MVAGLMNGKPPAVISCIDIRTLKESVENKVNENDQHVFITLGCSMFSIGPETSVRPSHWWNNLAINDEIQIKEVTFYFA